MGDAHGKNEPRRGHPRTKIEEDSLLGMGNGGARRHPVNQSTTIRGAISQKSRCPRRAKSERQHFLAKGRRLHEFDRL